jgi:hypothetical protein
MEAEERGQTFWHYPEDNASRKNPDVLAKIAGR